MARKPAVIKWRVSDDCDAVRFAIARDHGSRLLLAVVRETGHRPAAHGILEYDVESALWISSHSDLRIQKMLACYLQSYLQHRIRSADADSISSSTS